MSSLFVAFFSLVASSFRTRAALQAEILALRHQLTVLQKNAPPRLRLQRSDRLLWVLLSRWWPGWRRSLHIVRPDTNAMPLSISRSSATIASVRLMNQSNLVASQAGFFSALPALRSRTPLHRCCTGALISSPAESDRAQSRFSVTTHSLARILLMGAGSYFGLTRMGFSVYLKSIPMAHTSKRFFHSRALDHASSTGVRDPARTTKTRETGRSSVRTNRLALSDTAVGCCSAGFAVPCG
jgi:hypothetical protein